MTKQEAIHKADIIEECVKLLKDHQELMNNILDQMLTAELNLKNAEEKINEQNGKIQILQKLVREYQQSESDYQILLSETEPLLNELETLLKENAKLKNMIIEFRE